MVNRGYESFTRNCFEELKNFPGLDLRLFKGGGPSLANDSTLWNLPRTGISARVLGWLTGRGGYLVEQATFFLSLIPHLLRERPDVIYFSDGNLGNLLWHWRQLTKLEYRLLFSNGGPLSPPFPRWDYVQQVTSPHWEAALREGEPAARQCLVPYGFKAQSALPGLSSDERNAARARLQLPNNSRIVVSVGAVNASHKRMDYLIRELASIPAPRPFLAILGQRDRESLQIDALAQSLLTQGEYRIIEVQAEAVEDYYKAADLFVLCSLNEGFGRVFAEAMLRGLLCIAHDYDVARYVLNSYGRFADCTKTGALATTIMSVLAEEPDEQVRQLRHRSAYERFSWEHLRPSYARMIQDCSEMPLVVK